MLVPLTIYFDEIPKLKDLVKVVEVKKSAVVVNMFDAICKVENEQDVQAMYVAGGEMKSPKRRA